MSTVDFLDATKTLTGVSLRDLSVLLDEQLPAYAYKAVPGAVGLTDINPNVMRDKLNEWYGMCGLGWGYIYSAQDVQLQQQTVTVNRNGKPTQKETWFAQLLLITFWYKLVLEDGTIERYEVLATGASDNDVAAYALKGAITSAIGNAVSNIGFQKSVYLGQRSHNTVGKKAPVKPASGAKKSTPAKPAASTAKKSTPIATSSVPEENELVGVGPKAIERLGDQTLKALTFYATKMPTDGDPLKVKLQKNAQAILAARSSNGAKPVSVAA